MIPRTFDKSNGFSLIELLFTITLLIAVMGATISVVGFKKELQYESLNALVVDLDSWLNEAQGAAVRVGTCRIRFVTTSPSDPVIRNGDVLATIEPAACGLPFRANQDLEFRLNVGASTPLVNAGAASTSCPDITITQESITLLCGSLPTASNLRVFNVSFAAAPLPSSGTYPVSCFGVTDYSGLPIRGRGTQLGQPCTFDF